MLTLRTGLPGSGKTLRTVETAAKEAAEGREVFALNINGLDYDATGIKPWEKGLDAWRELPKGARLIVDEAQLYLPTRTMQQRVPEWVEQLTVHRHHGVDIDLVTQAPKLIDSFVRALITHHEHLVRVEGGYPKARVYYSDQGCMDIASRRVLKLAEYKLWSYPKGVYDLYKSSVEHTGKARVPQFVKVGAIAALVLLLCVGAAFGLMSKLSGDSDADAQAQTQPAPQLQRPAPIADSFARITSPSAAVQRPMTTGEYAMQWIPRIAGMPWSAPVYDRFEPAEPPRIYCIEGGRTGCGCYTEQATRIAIEYEVCRAIVAEGIYHPLLRPRQT